MAGAVRESVSARALERFRDALGADGVVSDRDALREFRDPYAYPSWEEHTASAMVMPRSVEQVQAVVRIAGEYGVSLWTFSQGRNYGYGGPAPRVGGSVLVNLRGMDRILEINEELAYALVEPGVRFFDLYEAVRERETFVRLLLKLLEHRPAPPYELAERLPELEAFARAGASG